MAKGGAPRMPIWEFYHSGDKQNESHARAYCLACIAKLWPDGVPLDDDHYMGINIETTKDEQWFKEATCQQLEAADRGAVRGVWDPMISHLIGKLRPCEHANDRAREVAKKMRNDGPTTGANKCKAGDDEGGSKKRTAVQARIEQFAQSKLKTYRAIDIPFTEAQITAIQEQCLRATVSANLPYRWIKDPKVLALFIMFRSAACDALPSREVLAERLLDNAAVKAEAATHEAVWSMCDVVDGSKNSVATANLAVAGESYLVDVLRTNGDGKDSKSMAKSFEQMIDQAEAKYKCTVVKLVTDNDGGARAGRELIAGTRPWVLTDPCMAHQGQLILGNYFKEHPKAEAAGDQASDIAGWLWNHQRVRKIFDTVQRDTNKNDKSLSYLVGNTTRWTTHMVAFHRLIDFRDALQRAVYTQREAIVLAQVGAEKNKKKKTQMELSARSACRTILDPTFWDDLEAAANDLEPIAYMTNINQTNATRSDQVALSFAGIFLYFEDDTGMKRRLEKRWSEFDQAQYVLALVLNPFEGMSRFGDKANVTVFVLQMEVVKLYRRCNSRPLPVSITDAQREAHSSDMKSKEKQLCVAFQRYCSDKGEWATFRASEETFVSVHGFDPVMAWKSMQTVTDMRELAGFAVMLLQLTNYQGGNECVFSDMGIKKTKLRNRLGLEKLGKMSKHMAHGLVKKRTGRKNHKETRVEQLLAVPRYAEALDGDVQEDGDREPEQPAAPARSSLVTSSAAWRRELSRWKARRDDEDSGDEDATPTAETHGPAR
ncbi:hypothetical protein AURDEDRAFT_167769 [Auricularia subglabra TFB-10046 SS5]|nr:hypothetical protein AURDEDRAFT_167769 [Auricularia subglabra TFB-10046 SS5]